MMVADHGTAPRRIIKESEINIVEITHVLGNVGEHKNLYRTDALDVVLGSAVLNGLRGNALIGKKIFVKKEVNGTRTSWVTDMLLHSKPLPNNKEVKGFAYHLTNNGKLRVFVPGYPNDLFFTDEQNSQNIKNYVGRWLVFNINEYAVPDGAFKCTEAEVYLTTKPSVYEEKQHYRMLLPCRRVTPASPFLSTMSYDHVDDSMNVLGAFGPRFEKFENEYIWLQLIVESQNGVRLVVSTDQQHISVAKNPVPSQQPYVAQSRNQCAPGSSNYSNQRPLSQMANIYIPQSGSTPRSSSVSNHNPMHPAYIPTPSTQRFYERSEPQRPRSPPRQNQNWSQDTEYTIPKRLENVIHLSDRRRPESTAIARQLSSSHASGRSSDAPPFSSRPSHRHNSNRVPKNEHTRCVSKPLSASSESLDSDDSLSPSEWSDLDEDSPRDTGRPRSPPRLLENGQRNSESVGPKRDTVTPSEPIGTESWQSRPRSPPRLHENEHQDEVYVQPKRVTVTSRTPSEPVESSTTRARSPPRVQKSDEEDDKYVKPQRIPKSSASSLPPRVESDSSRSRSPPRIKPNSQEEEEEDEPYVRPARITASKTPIGGESSNDSSSEQPTDLAAENAKLREQLEAIKKERDMYKVVHDMLLEQYDTWEFGAFLRSQSSALALRFYDAVYHPLEVLKKNLEK